MAGAAWGMVLGLGLASLWWSLWPAPEAVVPRRVRRRVDAVRDEIAAAGLPQLGIGSLAALSLVLGLLVFLLVYAVTRVEAIGLAFALMAVTGPAVWLRARARRRRRQLREVWPDVVDHVHSAVRAGLALPEALAQLGERGPTELRPAFQDFAHDYRATGRFGDALDRLKDRLADPVGDRLVEALRLAREVGGTDLGRVLRTLSTFLRDDARARAELEARQSWTVNAARLAMVAPWAVLLMLATRGTTLQAYRTTTGAVVLLIGAVLSVVAYNIMVRIGRLPEERRVLR